MRAYYSRLLATFLIVCAVQDAGAQPLAVNIPAPPGPISATQARIIRLPLPRTCATRVRSTRQQRLLSFLNRAQASPIPTTMRHGRGRASGSRRRPERWNARPEDAPLGGRLIL